MNTENSGMYSNVKEKGYGSTFIFKCCWSNQIGKIKETAATFNIYIVDVH